MVLADVCLCTTLIRFNLVYNPQLSCCRRKLVEHPNPLAQTREIYQMPGVAKTCNMAAIVDGCLGTLFPLNPGKIHHVMPASSSQRHL
jgi:putative glutathione S-transferase